MCAGLVCLYDMYNEGVYVCVRMWKCTLLGVRWNEYVTGNNAGTRRCLCMNLCNRNSTFSNRWRSQRLHISDVFLELCLYTSLKSQRDSMKFTFCTVVYNMYVCIYICIYIYMCVYILCMYVYIYIPFTINVYIIYIYVWIGYVYSFCWMYALHLVIL